jgi:hypothetical protein
MYPIPLNQKSEWYIIFFSVSKKNSYILYRLEQSIQPSELHLELRSYN